MKFDSRELERLVERSLQYPRRWHPASRRSIHAVEGVVLAAVLGYWLLGLLGVFA